MSAIVAAASFPCSPDQQRRAVSDRRATGQQRLGHNARLNGGRHLSLAAHRSDRLCRTKRLHSGHFPFCVSEVAHKRTRKTIEWAMWRWVCILALHAPTCNDWPMHAGVLCAASGPRAAAVGSISYSARRTIECVKGLLGASQEHAAPNMGVALANIFIFAREEKTRA